MRKSRFTHARRLLTLAAAVCLTGPVAQAITINSVSNASAPLDRTVEPFTVYGGVAGPSSGSGSSTTIDNCATATGLVPCNSARVHPNALLTINFKADAGAGRPVLWMVRNGTPTLIPTDPSSPTAVAAGAETYVAVRWGEICKVIGEGDGGGGEINASCDGTATGSVTATFRVGFVTSQTDSTANADQKDFKIVMGGDPSSLEQVVDDCNAPATNNYGVCAWEMNPGDEKALLREPVPHQGRTGPVMQFDRVRVFYVQAPDVNNPPFNTITAATKSFVDLRIESSDTGALTVVPGRVEGLQNDVTYAFKIAMVDLAGNVGFYTANGNGTNTGDRYCETPIRATPPNGGLPNCHLATPGEVVGVLSKQVTCFIATAAYGSQMAPQVETFRQFRNEFLLKHDLGIRFVRFYYKHSPKYAAMIAESAVLRAAARATLWPVLGFAWLSLQIGTSATAALIVMVLMSLYLVGRRYWSPRA